MRCHTLIKPIGLRINGIEGNCRDNRQAEKRLISSERHFLEDGISRRLQLLVLLVALT